MLNNLSEQVRDCLEHAEECARKAAAHPDGSPIRRDFLFLERNWRSLARSYQTGERLMAFLDDTERKATAPIIPFLLNQAFDPETVQAITNALVMTCEALGLSARDDAMTRLVAAKIIELAKRGIKSPTALHLAAMKEFKSDTQ